MFSKKIFWIQGMPEHFSRHCKSWWYCSFSLNALQWREVVWWFQICWQGTDTRLTNHYHFKSTSFPLTLLLCLYRIVLVGVWKGKQDHHREWGPPCQDLWWNGFRNLDCTIVRKGLHILKHQESIEGFRFKKALPGHHRSITRGDNYIIVRVGRTSDEMFSYPIGVVNNVLGIPIATCMIR